MHKKSKRIGLCKDSNLALIFTSHNGLLVRPHTYKKGNVSKKLKWRKHVNKMPSNKTLTQETSSLNTLQNLPFTSLAHTKCCIILVNSTQILMETK